MFNLSRECFRVKIFKSETVVGSCREKIVNGREDAKTEGSESIESLKGNRKSKIKLLVKVYHVQRGNKAKEI